VNHATLDFEHANLSEHSIFRPCRSSVTPNLDTIRDGVTDQDLVFLLSFSGLSRFRKEATTSEMASRFLHGPLAGPFSLRRQRGNRVGLKVATSVRACIGFAAAKPGGADPGGGDAAPSEPTVASASVKRKGS
jgi:hypothetical protein